MVLVDPSIPDQFARLAAATPKQEKEEAAELAGEVARLRNCAAGLRAGTLAQADPDGCLARNPAAPPALNDALAQRQRDPARFETQASFFAELPASAKLIVDPRRRYGALPLIVLTAADTYAVAPAAGNDERSGAARGAAVWNAGHDALAALSLRGVNRTIEHTGHMMQQQRPDAIVTAIGELLDKLPPR